MIGSATVADLPVTGAVQNFTADEGTDTGMIVLATFTDPNTLATVANVTASLRRQRLGRRHADGADTTLTVTQIGVTPLTAALHAGDPIFEVTRQPHVRRGDARVRSPSTSSSRPSAAL